MCKGSLTIQDLCRLFTLITVVVVPCASCGPARDTPGEMNHDFGTVERSKQLETTFTIKNTTGEDFDILNIKTSCGCATATPNSSHIPAGGTGRVGMSFVARGKPGPKTATAIVFTSSQKQSTVTLHANCDFRPKLFTSKEAVELGALNDYEVGISHAEFEVESGDEALYFEIKSINVSGAPELSAETVARIPGQQYLVRLTNRVPLSAGTYSGEVIVETEPPAPDPLSVRISARVKGKVMVQPALVSLDPARVHDGHADFYLRVLPGYVDEFHIVKIDAPTAISFDVAQTGRYYTVLFKNIPLDCSLNGCEIRIHTDVPAFPPLSVPIRVLGCGEQQSQKTSHQGN